MKILNRSLRYNTNVYTVELEESDKNKSDVDLINECGSWKKSGPKGEVNRLSNNIAVVSIFTNKE